MQEKIRIYYITVSKNIYLGEIMRYKRFYEFIFISFITICLFLGDSQAGEIQDISFDDHSIIYIKHKNCTLEKTIQGSQKLIIPLKNCKVSTGNIETLNNDLKRIYWMQYDSNTVWVIVAFADSYESDKFEIETHIDKFKICLIQNLSISLHSRLATLFEIPSTDGYFIKTGISSVKHDFRPYRVHNVLEGITQLLESKRSV